MKRKTIRLAAMAISAVFATVLMAGCGSGSPTASTSSSSCAGEKQYYIIFATHAFPHPFFKPMQQGATDGAAAACMKVKWTESPSTYDFNDTVNRMNAAIAEKPDVLVVSLANAQAADASCKAALAAGIVVIDVNVADSRPAGQRCGYISYVGITNEYNTGVAAALEVLKVRKPKLAVVGNNFPGDPGLTPRVKGWEDTMAAAGVPTAELDVQKNTQQVIDTYITAHPDMDALYTLSNAVNGAASARVAIANHNLTGKIMLVCTDYDMATLQAIKSGGMVAAIDQQQYLQGYLPSILARTYFRTGEVPSEVSTGPGVINASNVDHAIASFGSYR